MKKIALMAAAAALAVAAPAAAETGGYLGLEYGAADIEFLGDDELTVWQGEGAWGWRDGAWGFQLDGAFANIEEDSGTEGDAFSLNGHFYWQSDAWRFGGVVAHTTIDPDGSSSSAETVFGVESMFDIGPSANFYASLTAGQTEFILDADTWNFDVGANFYATPNARIGGFIGFGGADFSSGVNVDSFSAGIDGEFQPWSAPISLTAAWNFFEIDDSDLEASSFRVGVRWNFGADTLQERDAAIPFTTYAPLLDRVDGIW